MRKLVPMKSIKLTGLLIPCAFFSSYASAGDVDWFRGKGNKSDFCQSLDLVKEGIFESKTNNHAKAIKAFEKAISIYGHSPEFYVNLGNEHWYLAQTTLLQAERNAELAESIKSYSKACELSPRFADAIYNQANALIVLGRSVPGEAALRRVLRIDRKHFGATLNLGLLYLERDRPNEALALFRHLDPRDLLPAQKDLLSSAFDALTQREETRDRQKLSMKTLPPGTCLPPPTVPFAKRAPQVSFDI